MIPTNIPRKLGGNRMPPSPCQVADLCVEQPANPRAGRIIELMKVVHTKSPHSNSAHAEIVGMGMAAVPFLMQAIERGELLLLSEIYDIAKNNPNEDWRGVAALLGKIGGEKAYDREHAYNVTIMQVLAAIGDISEVDVLMRMASQDVDLMRYAIWGIGEIAARHPEHDCSRERRVLETIRDIFLPSELKQVSRRVQGDQDAIRKALEKMPGQ